MRDGGVDNALDGRPKAWDNYCTSEENNIMSDRDQIVEQALSLAAEDRAFIADALEQSLTRLHVAKDRTGLA